MLFQEAWLNMRAIGIRYTSACILDWLQVFWVVTNHAAGKIIFLERIVSNCTRRPDRIHVVVRNHSPQAPVHRAGSTVPRACSPGAVR